MDYLPTRKGTILIPSGRVKHLHFICCDPVFYPHQQTDCILAVNISSINDGSTYDDSCILTSDDHSFIKHPSYVYYAKAAIFGAVSVSQQVSSGDFDIHDPCSEEALKKILDGFQISENVTFKVKRFFENYCI